MLWTVGMPMLGCLKGSVCHVGVAACVGVLGVSGICRSMQSWVWAVICSADTAPHRPPQPTSPPPGVLAAQELECRLITRFRTRGGSIKMSFPPFLPLNRGPFWS